MAIPIAVHSFILLLALLQTTYADVTPLASACLGSNRVIAFLMSEDRPEASNHEAAVAVCNMISDGSMAVLSTSAQTEAVLQLVEVRISCPQVNHICRKHCKRDPYQIIMLIELHITHKVSDGAILAVLAPPQLLPLCKQQPSFSHDAYAEAQRAR